MLNEMLIPPAITGDWRRDAERLAEWFRQIHVARISVDLQPISELEFDQASAYATRMRQILTVGIDATKGQAAMVHARAAERIARAIETSEFGGEVVERLDRVLDSVAGRKRRLTA